MSINTLDKISSAMDLILNETKEAYDDWVIHQLEDILDEIAPPYMEPHCVISEDGEDVEYIFRPSEEQIRQDIRDGWIVAISDLAELSEEMVQDYALLTNDHGNRTLYGLDDLENPTVIWEFV